MCAGNKGSGFIYFHSQEKANKAVALLNGYSLKGRKLTVALDKRRKAVIKVDAHRQALRRYPYSINLTGFGLPEDAWNITKLCSEAVGVKEEEEAIPEVSIHRRYLTGDLLLFKY